MAGVGWTNGTSESLGSQTDQTFRSIAISTCWADLLCVTRITNPKFPRFECFVSGSPESWSMDRIPNRPVGFCPVAGTIIWQLGWESKRCSVKLMLNFFPLSTVRTDNCPISNMTFWQYSPVSCFPAEGDEITTLIPLIMTSMRGVGA
jgi:hypothetical protein